VTTKGGGVVVVVVGAGVVVVVLGMVNVVVVCVGRGDGTSLPQAVSSASRATTRATFFMMLLSLACLVELAEYFECQAYHGIGIRVRQATINRHGYKIFGRSTLRLCIACRLSIS
jgi:hypothetical protein